MISATNSHTVQQNTYILERESKSDQTLTIGNPR